MDLNLIKKLINLVEKHDIQELEVQEGELKVCITKSKAQEFTSTTIQPSVPLKQETPPVLEERKETSNFIAIKSPMVGTFYRTPAPGAPPYVEVGDTVSLGKIVCIIEAMKVMNEIEAEVSGRIAKVLVENEKPVEFGQELFIVEPI